jgi:hypothetical protein
VQLAIEAVGDRLLQPGELGHQAGAGAEPCEADGLLRSLGLDSKIGVAGVGGAATLGFVAIGGYAHAPFPRGPSPATISPACSRTARSSSGRSACSAVKRRCHHQGS